MLSNNSFKCVIVALTYDNHIILSGTQQEPELPCLNLQGEVNQKVLSNAFFQLTSCTSSRQFMLISRFNVQQETFQVYSVMDRFQDKQNYLPVSTIFNMVEQGLIKDEKTRSALEILKKCMVNQKNFDEQITKNDAEAKRRLSSIHNDSLTNEDKDYIKQYYRGRQQFMAFYTDFSLSRLLSELLHAKNGTLLEPSCGSGRLLEYLERDSLTITCYEIDPKSAKVCSILYPEANIICEDALGNLEQVEGNFDYCICSPPWGLYVGKLEKYDLTAKLGGEDCTFYFIELAIRALKNGGKGIILLPTSMFQMEQYSKFFELLEDWVQILVQIDLPKECFTSSNINVESTILLFKRTQGCKNNSNEFPYFSISREEWEDYSTGRSEAILTRFPKEVV